MIKKITKIETFGILDKYQPTDDLLPFNALNVIYRWNGSGKTTLDRFSDAWNAKPSQ